MTQVAVKAFGGFPAAVIELLVNAAPGLIRLFPAIPAAWKKGSIEGVWCPGPLTIVHLSWDLEQGNARLVLEAPGDQTVEVVLPDASRTSVTISGGAETKLELSWNES